MCSNNNTWEVCAYSFALTCIQCNTLVSNGALVENHNAAAIREQELARLCPASVANCIAPCRKQTLFDVACTRTHVSCKSAAISPTGETVSLPSRTSFMNVRNARKMAHVCHIHQLQLSCCTHWNVHVSEETWSAEPYHRRQNPRQKRARLRRTLVPTEEDYQINVQGLRARDFFICRKPRHHLGHMVLCTWAPQHTLLRQGTRSAMREIFRSSGIPRGDSGS